MEPPPGFVPLFRTSPFLEIIGPVFSRGRGPDLVVGLQVQRKHCNARGLVHGGVLSTLADIGLGYALESSTESALRGVTASLTLDFAGSAKEGDWLETRADIQRVGGRLAFANCYIWVGEQRIVRASAVFAITRQTEG